MNGIYLYFVNKHLPSWDLKGKWKSLSLNLCCSLNGGKGMINISLNCICLKALRLRQRMFEYENYKSYSTAPEIQRKKDSNVSRYPCNPVREILADRVVGATLKLKDFGSCYRCHTKTESRRFHTGTERFQIVLSVSYRNGKISDRVIRVIWERKAFESFYLCKGNRIVRFIVFV